MAGGHQQWRRTSLPPGCGISPDGWASRVRAAGTMQCLTRHADWPCLCRTAYGNAGGRGSGVSCPSGFRPHAPPMHACCLLAPTARCQGGVCSCQHRQRPQPVPMHPALAGSSASRYVRRNGGPCRAHRQTRPVLEGSAVPGSACQAACPAAHGRLCPPSASPCAGKGPEFAAPLPHALTLPA